MLTAKLPLKTCRRFLLPNTAKFLSYQTVILQHQIEETLDESLIRSLEKQLQEIRSYLKWQYYTPSEQSAVSHLGNKVRMLWNRNEVVKVLDSITYGKNPFVLSVNAPFGESVFGKVVGEEGIYVVNSSRLKSPITHEFRIIEIEPYSEAKKLIKSFKGIHGKRELLTA